MQLFRYNASERRVLAALQRAKGKEWTLEEIAAVYYGDKQWPKTWRVAMNAFMRDLSTKTQFLEKQSAVVRVSARGRGHTSQWGVISIAS